MNNRERLSSRLGFILLSAGCAIGCGNVWKFPWMAGQYGGGGFVLIYVICLILLGLPVMTMEFAMGRASQKSPVKFYQELEPKGSKWHIHGYLALLGNIALMAFYTVVTGWMIYYFVKFLLGQTAELGFVAMITNPGVNVTFMLIAVVLGFAVLCFNLQGGLERVTKYMMVALLGVMYLFTIRPENKRKKEAEQIDLNANVQGADISNLTTEERLSAFRELMGIEEPGEE